MKEWGVRKKNGLYAIFFTLLNIISKFYYHLKVIWVIGNIR